MSTHPQAAPARPESAPGRDLRLDLLRGLCVARMILVHLGWNSEWIRFPFGVVTAAEGFFLISGVTLGKVGRRYAETGRSAELARRLVLRAGWLWLANTALVILFRKLVGTCANPAGALGWFWGDTPRWLQILSFDQASVLQVLPRYVVFLLAAPLVLLALRAGRGLWVVVASVALWALHRALPDGALLPVVESSRADFPVAAWQLLFVVGMVLGYRDPAAGASFSIAARRRWLITAALLVAAFALFEQLWIASLQEPFRGEIVQLFGRPALGPLRLLNLAALAVVLFYLADRYRDAIVRVGGCAPSLIGGWLLLPIGQRALGAFLLHVPLVWVAPCASAWAPGAAFAFLYAWAGLVLVGFAIRWRFLKRLLAPV